MVFTAKELAKLMPDASKIESDEPETDIKGCDPMFSEKTRFLPPRL